MRFESVGVDALAGHQADPLFLLLDMECASCPVWADDATPLVAELTAEQTDAAVAVYHAEQTDAAIEDGSAEWQTPTLRLEQVRDLYVAYRRAKIGIVGGQGVNDKTFLNDSRNLKGALAGVDLRQVISGFGYAEVEQLRDSIFRRVRDGEGGIKKRTANNYWNEARRLLDWADRQRNVPYEHPKHVTELFKQRFRDPNPINIAKYDAEQLKTLLKAATNRQRLYVYLSLNCGHTQVDIGNLRRDEVTEFEGRPAIVRKRSKTSHQNDFEALHTLWPETYALLRQEMAGANAAGLALLSKRGTPLYRTTPHCDLVSDSYLVLQKRSGVKLSLKQLRKLGASAIQRIGGDETRRLYKAGTIDSGDKVYVRDAWENLTPHLLAWGEQLRADGVLSLPDAP